MVSESVLAGAFEVTTIEMHTGGEPLRIVTGGYSAQSGRRLLDKRRAARDNHDVFRRLLMHEPRGHAEMYGALPVEPDHPEADLAVLFLHGERYSTMCGHAVIALGRWAVDSGLVEAKAPETEAAIQVPCGLVRARVAVEKTAAGYRRGRVSFRSVPSFVLARLALKWTRGEIALDQARDFESLTGARFTGSVVEETRAGPHRAIVAEVAGAAHYTGEARFTLEAGDPLAEGLQMG